MYLNIFDLAYKIAEREGETNWDNIVIKAGKIRTFLDRYPAVTKFALTGEGSDRVKKLYGRMINV